MAFLGINRCGGAPQLCTGRVVRQRSGAPFVSPDVMVPSGVALPDHLGLWGGLSIDEPAGEGRDMTETLVLVPGLNCTARLFEPQVAALRAGREILIADHARDDTMAAIARRLLDRAPERFALAGLSMGGYIALEVMHQAPERVARLALLDTNARADTDEQRRSREREIVLAREGRFAQVCEARWARSVLAERRSDPELRRVYDLMAAETGPEVFARQLRAIMGRRDSRPMLPAIRAPTLIVVGDADELTPPEQAREMAGLIPAAALLVVPRCGHLSTLERPQAVNAALAIWVGG